MCISACVTSDESYVIKADTHHSQNCLFTEGQWLGCAFFNCSLILHINVWLWHISFNTRLISCDPWSRFKWKSNQFHEVSKDPWWELISVFANHIFLTLHLVLFLMQHTRTKGNPALISVGNYLFGCWRWSVSLFLLHARQRVQSLFMVRLWIFQCFILFWYAVVWSKWDVIYEKPKQIRLLPQWTKALQLK